MEKNNFASIESIISVAKKGGMFILVDDEKRENEGDLVISTSDSNAKNINFMAKYGRGLICLALDSLQAKRLNLSLMSPVNQSRNKTAFTISIEAKKGITTGISAKDRAKTIKIASKKNVNKKDIVSPGHVFPIIARDGGVLVRAGHTEASVDISKLAKKRREMQKSLDLGKMINSNQASSYRTLAQVTRSVPLRVNFTKISFDGEDNLIIEGMAFSDQDILNFISNLNSKSLIFFA